MWETKIHTQNKENYWFVFCHSHTSITFLHTGNGRTKHSEIWGSRQSLDFNLLTVSSNKEISLKNQIRKNSGSKYVRSPGISAWDLATARPLTIADKCVGEWHTNSRREVTPGIRVQCWAGLAEYWLPEVALSVTTRQSLAATRRHFSVVAMLLTIYKHNHEAAYRTSHDQKLHKQLWVSYSVAYLPRISTVS